MNTDDTKARQSLIQTALRSAAADLDDDGTNTWLAAECDYRRTHLAFAALAYVDAIDALPEDQQPGGWRQKVSTP